MLDFVGRTYLWTRACQRISHVNALLILLPLGTLLPLNGAEI